MSVQPVAVWWCMASTNLAIHPTREIACQLGLPLLCIAGQHLHIPYRDSKLTLLLKPSLGGNAKTSIICTINPAASHVDETCGTLRFACRAKRVINSAVPNEVRHHVV